MKIDLEHYSVHRKSIQMSYKESKLQDIGFFISMWCACSQFPCIVAAFFLAEDIGFTPELTKLIDSLIKTYHYDEILNQKLDSYYLTLDTNHAIKLVGETNETK
jgi:hypothetical protein